MLEALIHTQWSDILKDVVLLLLGATGTAIWFFWRRKVQQAPEFENIQKAEMLLSLRKELDNTNYTIGDLKSLEDALMGRAEAAKKLSVTYEQEAQQVREIEMNTAMTQAEMNIVADEAYRKALRKLDKTIEEMKVYFSPEKCVRFEKANQAWHTYQQIHADFVSSQYEGGSLKPLIHASTMEAVTIARIVELETELKFMKDTQVPYVERESF